MVAWLVLLVKTALIGRVPEKPTEAEIAAFEEFEDARCSYGEYPSPMEVWEWDVERHERWMRLSVFTLLRWRLAVARVPFTRRERWLFPRPISRALFPSVPF